MSAPHVAVTHAEIARAQQAHNDAIAGIAASNQRTTAHITGDLMAQARGDYAVSLNSLAHASDQRTVRVNQRFQANADLLGTTNNKSGAVDTDGSSGFQRLLSFLNQ